MYSKIKSIVSEFVAEHDLASKAKMEQDFLVDMLTVELFNGLNQKEPAQPKPRPTRTKPEEKKDENQTNLLNLNLGSEVAK